MNKRSAVLMALGLTAALVAGGIAVATGAGPSTGEASIATPRGTDDDARGARREDPHAHRGDDPPAGRLQRRWRGEKFEKDIQKRIKKVI